MEHTTSKKPKKTKKGLVRVEQLDPLDTRVVPWIYRAIYMLTPVFALGGNFLIFAVLRVILDEWLHATFSVNWLDLLGIAAFGGGYIVPLIIRERIRDRYPLKFRVVSQRPALHILVRESYEKPWREHDGVEWLAMARRLPQNIEPTPPTVHTRLAKLAYRAAPSVIARDWSRPERIVFEYHAFDNSWRKTHRLSFDVLVEPSDEGIQAFCRWYEAMRDVLARVQRIYERSVPADEILRGLLECDLTYGVVSSEQQRSSTAYRAHQPILQTSFVEERPTEVERVRIDETEERVRVDAKDELAHDEEEDDDLVEEGAPRRQAARAMRSE